MILDIQTQPMPEAATADAAPARPSAAAFWLAHGAALAVLLGLNFFLRCYLDQAEKHVNSFLTVNFAEHLPEIYELSWWEYLLPIRALNGNWCTTTLLLVHGLEHVLDGPANVFFAVNAFMVAVAYVLSWQVFRSWVFTITCSLCFAFTTFNHHVYIVSGAVALPLLVSYLMFFLYCQYKLLESDCNYRVWAPLGVLSLVAYAIGYEGWLDCMACMWLAYPVLIALAWRAGDRRRMFAASAIVVFTTLAAVLYIVFKLKLGFGQHRGNESDVVFNYGRAHFRLIWDDLISHFFTLFFITITNFSPPFLFNASLSSYHYTPEQIVQLQHGYHEAKVHLVVYNHLFLWRFYAGVAAAAFVYWLWKSLRSAWKAPSPAAIAFFLFLLMSLVSGSTHMAVKYRPMHSAPFLGYHSYFGIVGFTLLLSYGAMWINDHFQRRWLAWTLVGLLWINIAYCAFARPPMLSRMATDCGFGPYPDAWGNLKTLVRSWREP